jgi:hypothetical protein
MRADYITPKPQNSICNGVEVQIFSSPSRFMPIGDACHLGAVYRSTMAHLEPAAGG